MGLDKPVRTPWIFKLIPSNYEKALPTTQAICFENYRSKMIFQHCVMPKTILKKFEKGKNGNFIYFLKFSSGRFLTLLETDDCVIYIFKYVKFRFCHFQMHILLFSYLEMLMKFFFFFWKDVWLFWLHLYNKRKELT